MVTFNINGRNIPNEDIFGQTNKTKICVVYKKLTSNIIKVQRGRKVYHSDTPQKK